MPWTLIAGKLAEFAIMQGIKYLVHHNVLGIGNKLATAMINGVAASQLNPVTGDVVKDALIVLEGDK